MSRTIAYAGVPTSLGSYCGGQEKAPRAFREAGFPEMLHKVGLPIVDLGDLAVRRWRPDKENLRAQHWKDAVACVQETEAHLMKSANLDHIPVIVGGNCTIILGVIAANLKKGGNLGLIYFDLHSDMNTPSSTDEGGLDWMGIAHMLGLQGAIPELASFGPRYPLLTADSVYLAGFDPASATEWERNTIHDRNIPTTSVGEIALSPIKCAESILAKWVPKFDRFLVHFDVDVVDFYDLPLAENYSRNKGLPYTRAMEFLEVLVRHPKFGGLTLTEINPDHGAEDGSTIRNFAKDLSKLLAQQ